MFGIFENTSSLCHGVPRLMIRPPLFRMFCSSSYWSFVFSRSARLTRSSLLQMSSVITYHACFPVMELLIPSPSSCGAPIGLVHRFVDRWVMDSELICSSTPYITFTASRITSLRRIFDTMPSISLTSLSVFRRKMMFSFGRKTISNAIATARQLLL